MQSENERKRDVVRGFHGFQLGMRLLFAVVIAAAAGGDEQVQLPTKCESCLLFAREFLVAIERVPL